MDPRDPRSRGASRGEPGRRTVGRSRGQLAFRQPRRAADRSNGHAGRRRDVHLPGTRANDAGPLRDPPAPGHRCGHVDGRRGRLPLHQRHELAPPSIEIVDLARLIERVGADNFSKAKANAWTTAAGTGTAGPTLPAQLPDESTEVAYVPHELNDLIWFDENLPWVERVATTFTLYRVMPSYAVLMMQSGFYDEMDSAARDLLWDQYRSLIS